MNVIMPSFRKSTLGGRSCTEKNRQETQQVSSSFLPYSVKNIAKTFLVATVSGCGHMLYLFVGLPDARPILHHIPVYHWEDMGNTAQTQAKIPDEDVRKDEPALRSDEGKASHYHGTFELVEKVRDSSCCQSSSCCLCLKVLFVVLCLVAVLKSIGEIFVTVSAAITNQLFSAEQSGRLVGMVLLALLAAVTISILVYALVAVFRKQEKPLHAAALVLFITAVIQAVVVGVAVRLTFHDVQLLEKGMRESFGLARDANPRHLSLWSATQSDLVCCGLYGPDDYRTYNLPEVFPPNVPIACCPSYDSSRSDLVQERERETCKARRLYYHNGCREAVVEAVKTTSHLVLGLTISLMVLEIVLSILAAILHRKVKDEKEEEKNDDANP